MKKETYPFMNMSYKKCRFSKDDEMEPPPLHSWRELYEKINSYTYSSTNENKITTSR